MAQDSRPFRSVPDVVGLPFSIGRQEAEAYGVALANPDPDGPPIGASAWPADPAIVAQEPVAGEIVRQWDSVKVWLQDGPDMASIPHDDPVGVDAAHAVPDAPPADVDLMAERSEESDGSSR